MKGVRKATLSHRKARSIHLPKVCKPPVLTGELIPFGDEILDIDDLLTRAYANSKNGSHSAVPRTRFSHVSTSS